METYLPAVGYPEHLCKLRVETQVLHLLPALQ